MCPPSVVPFPVLFYCGCHAPFHIKRFLLYCFDVVSSLEVEEFSLTLVEQDDQRGHRPQHGSEDREGDPGAEGHTGDRHGQGSAWGD
jgi:hypothetical protein